MAPAAPHSLGLARLLSLATASSAFRLPSSSRTIGAALQTATSAFASGGVPEPALSAEHLLARCAGLGTSRAALSIHGEEELDAESRAAFERMCARRLAREPVQYILGDWDFMDLTLEVRPPVLIPRPETEGLVELVAQAHGDAAAFLDVGCGTGAIGLALLSRLPAARCVGIDVSASAAALAARNAELCGLDDRYSAAAVDGGVAAWRPSDQRFDVVVSNPPYIPRADYEQLDPEVAGHEDERALCGGDDGLDVVREVLLAAPRLLRQGGPRAVWLEVDPSHPPLIEAWLRDARPDLGMELARAEWDVFGRLRFCEVRWRGGVE